MEEGRRFELPGFHPLRYSTPVAGHSSSTLQSVGLAPTRGLHRAAEAVGVEPTGTLIRSRLAGGLLTIRIASKMGAEAGFEPAISGL